MNSVSSLNGNPPNVGTTSWLMGGGAMGDAVRAFDWSKSPLGPIDSWPQSLRSTVGLCLNGRFPMFLWWGPDLVNLYNDAYIPILGQRHPHALGGRAREIWHDVWPAVAPQVEAVLRRGESSWQERVPIVTTRNGHEEEAYFTYSYSPVFDESSRVTGLLCVVSEETAVVAAARRQAFLMELSETLRRFSSPSDPMASAVAALGKHLKANRVGYGLVHPDGETIVVEASYAHGVQPIHGTFALESFGAENVALQRQGITVVHRDVAEIVPYDPTTWAAVATRSFVSVPLIRDGRFRATLYVNQREPRRWTEDEVSLIEEVSNRLWEALERVRAESELRRSEARFRLMAARSEQQRRLHDTILSGTPDLVCVFDLDHRFTYANQALLTMCGKSWEEAIGKDCLELGFEPWHAAMHNREIEQVIATKQRIRGEVPFAGTHGRRIYDYIFVPVLGADGQVEAIAGTTRDVTERKQAEERQAFLLTLADAIRPLRDPEAVKVAASRVLGERLRVHRAFYTEIEGDDWVVEGGYASGVEPLPPGRYSADEYGHGLMNTLRAGEKVIFRDARNHPSLAPAEREAHVVAHIVDWRHRCAAREGRKAGRPTYGTFG